MAGLEYTALLDLPEVPDNSSISMGLESVCAANGAKAEIRIKVDCVYCMLWYIHASNIYIYIYMDA